MLNWGKKSPFHFLGQIYHFRWQSRESIHIFLCVWNVNILPHLVLWLLFLTISGRRIPEGCHSSHSKEVSGEMSRPKRNLLSSFINYPKFVDSYWGKTLAFLQPKTGTLTLSPKEGKTKAAVCMCAWLLFPADIHTAVNALFFIVVSLCKTRWRIKRKKKKKIILCIFTCGSLVISLVVCWKQSIIKQSFFCILSTAVDMYVSGIHTNIHLASTRET